MPESDVFIDFSKAMRPAPAYCDCEFPNCVTLATYKGHVPDLVKCRCGEEGQHRLQWKWQSSKSTDTLFVGPDITFHPIYSQGAAIVRGEEALQTGMVHYWEIRIITPLCGTDVMIGIGTDKVDLDQFKFHFVSALGTNNQSWGFSYLGKKQHNGVRLPYGQRFTQGCIIGVYLDRTCGHLEFFLNRRSLGVAYKNIPLDPKIKLYPMVCSTAARCAMRLINSTSLTSCLQLRAFQALSKEPKALGMLRQVPGLDSIREQYWFLAPPVRYSRHSKENDLDILDEAVLSSKTRLARKQKFKDEDTDINDLYSNAHKIAMQQNDSDDDYLVSEYFDEYFHYLF